MTCNGGQWDIQCHSRSSILILVVCHFLVVSNTSLCAILHSFQVIVAHGFNYHFLVWSKPRNSGLQNLTSENQKYNSVRWCMLSHIGVNHQCDRQTELQQQQRASVKCMFLLFTVYTHRANSVSSARCHTSLIVTSVSDIRGVLSPRNVIADASAQLVK